MHDPIGHFTELSPDELEFVSGGAKTCRRIQINPPGPVLGPVVPPLGATGPGLLDVAGGWPDAVFTL